MHAPTSGKPGRKRTEKRGSHQRELKTRSLSTKGGKIKRRRHLELNKRRRVADRGRKGNKESGTLSVRSFRNVSAGAPTMGRVPTANRTEKDAKNLFRKANYWYRVAIVYVSVQAP